MNTLFPIEPVFPPGFLYVPDFISREDEQRLIEEISKIELHPFSFQGFIANRKVASFGYDYRFDKGSLIKGQIIPSGFAFVSEKIGEMLSIKADQFAELLVTEYPPGSVINWHRDAPPFDIIAGVSLMADCTFRLRPHPINKPTRSPLISFPVKPRSLYVMQGASRSEWQHSIAPVKEKRFSITLRTLKQNITSFQ